MNTKTNQQARSCETNLEQLVDCMFHKIVAENVDLFLRDLSGPIDLIWGIQ